MHMLQNHHKFRRHYAGIQWHSQVPYGGNVSIGDPGTAGHVCSIWGEGRRVEFPLVTTMGVAYMTADVRGVNEELAL